MAKHRKAPFPAIKSIAVPPLRNTNDERIAARIRPPTVGRRGYEKSKSRFMARRKLAARRNLPAGGAAGLNQVGKFPTFWRSLVCVEPAIAFDRCSLVGCRSMLIVDSG
jgi:hypothetical protein